MTTTKVGRSEEAPERKGVSAAMALGLVAFLAAGDVSAAIPTAERQALIDLYNSTNGPGWTNRTGWLGAAGTECSWYGVTCGGGGAWVAELVLPSNLLSGALPATLGQLTHLEKLQLFSNQLSGSIPPGLGGLAALTSLVLYSNQLTGSIPAQLGTLSNLEALNLSENQLSGSIPSELGALTNLVFLHLNSNQLSGGIPPQLGNLANVQQLYLSSNQLSGSIPSQLGALSKLQDLQLRYNQLTGSLPTSMGGMAWLYNFDCSHNQISESIPAELGALSNLRYVSLDANQLSGGIPVQLGNLTGLRRLVLSSNRLNGGVPAQLGNLTSLQGLWLGGNQLSGSIPVQLGNLTSLGSGMLDLRYNAFYSDDPGLVSFLNSKQYLGDWQSTQTIAPKNVAAGAATQTSLTVSWTPIAYTAGPGYYEVLRGTTPGGPYSSAGQTSSKTATSLSVTGLVPGTTYTFVVRAATLAHASNQSTVVSEYGSEASGSTLACQVTLSPSSTTVPASGAPAATFQVQTSAGCPWTATSDDGWITITAGGSGTGAGTVTYSVAANAGPSRAGTITAGGQTFSVTQDAGCAYVLSPTNATLPASGAPGLTFQVQAAAGCTWTAASSSGWLTVTGGTPGTGTGTVTYAVSANAGPARTGTITAGGQAFTVTQAGGCTYTLSPPGAALPSAGATGLTFLVQTAAGCAWTAASNAGWIAITAGSPATGTGAVTYAVSANAGPSRTGAITAGGQTFTVSQEAGCTYSLDPASATIPASGAEWKTFVVQTTAGCAWAAASSEVWITITGGGSGTGTGTVTYSVAANAGPSRTGAITAGGQAFLVTQDGECRATLSSSGASAPASGVAGLTFQVQTSAGCSWSATSHETWITITAGSSGTGEGTVTFALAANPGPLRAGTISAAGQIFTVTQDSGCAYALNPSSATIPSAGAEAEIFRVETHDGCAWTAVAEMTWITVTGGAAGSGSGEVAYRVAENRGAARTGTVLVAGSRFTVTQAAREQGLSLSPSMLALSPGTSAPATVTLVPTRPETTVVSLSSSSPTVATVPSTLTVPTGTASTTFLVTAVGLGTARVVAALPPDLGGGSVWMEVEVGCDVPSAPRATGPESSLPRGAAFSLSWTDALGVDGGGSYEAQLALEPGFAQPVSALRTPSRSGAFIVPPGAIGAVYARVRAVAGCGEAGPYSSVVGIPVATAPASVILTQGQSPEWTATRGQALPRATLRFRNIGEIAAPVTFVVDGGFFRSSPESTNLPAGEEVVVTLDCLPEASGQIGSRRGAVVATWPGGTVAAAVALAVAESVADVVPDVEPDTVYNLASGVGPFTRELVVTNPGELAMGLAAVVGPGGAWLTVEPADLTEPLPPRQSRSVRLRIDRSKRTVADGEPPVFTLLTLRSVGGTEGRLVRIIDAEPVELGPTPDRTPARRDTPTFIVPTAVHASGLQNALFTSDGWLRNLAARPVPVEILASPRGGGASLKAGTVLPGLSLVRLFDLVQGVFGQTNLAANVEVRPESLADAAQLVVRITTEGQPWGGGASRRYSSEIPVYASGTGTGVGEAALVIPGIDVTESVRTNVILSETSGAAASVRLSLYGADGTLVGESQTPVHVGPYGLEQSSVQGYLGLAEGAVVRSGVLRVEGSSGTGRVVALATAIDNVTQSFRALSAESEKDAGSGRALSAGEPMPVVIPAVAHTVGQNAFFTTRLEVSNQTLRPAALRFVYAYTGRDETGRDVSGEMTVERTIPARQALAPEVGEDVVVNLLGVPPRWNTSGSLRVEGPGIGQVIVKSWVQTPTDLTRPTENLKYAEFQAFSATSPQVVGAGGALVVLSTGVSKLAGQRTNLILTEVAGQPSEVRITLVDGATGLSIGRSGVIPVGAYRKVQINDPELWPLLELAAGDRDRMQMVLESVGAGGGRVAGVLTQIDNTTNATLVTPFVPPGPQSPGIGVGR